MRDQVATWMDSLSHQHATMSQETIWIKARIDILFFVRLLPQRLAQFVRYMHITSLIWIWSSKHVLYHKYLIIFMEWIYIFFNLLSWWSHTSRWSEMLPGPGGIVCVLCNALWITCLFRKCVASNVLYFPVYLFSNSVHWIVEHLCTKRAVV